MGVAARILVIGASLWVATLIVPGIEMRYTSPGDSIATLLGVALIFGLVNAVLRARRRITTLFRFLCVMMW